MFFSIYSIRFDIKPLLFHELMLKEKDFREFLKQHDWNKYKNAFVAITCSNEAIVPTWAYMLLANKMAPFAETVVFGNLEVLETVLFDRKLNQLDLENYREQRVVIKGCGEIPIPSSSYIELTVRLSHIAKSIMYGEPCSTVPIFKRK